LPARERAGAPGGEHLAVVVCGRFAAGGGFCNDLYLSCVSCRFALDEAAQTPSFVVPANQRRDPYRLILVVGKKAVPPFVPRTAPCGYGSLRSFAGTTGSLLFEMCTCPGAPALSFLRRLARPAHAPPRPRCGRHDPSAARRRGRNARTLPVRVAIPDGPP